MHIKGIGINIDSSTIDGDLDFLEETLQDMQNIGFDYAEIPVHGVDAIIKGKLNWLQTKAIVDILKIFSMKYTVHSPDVLNLMDARNFKLQKEVFKSAIEFTHAIGAEIFVYHGGKIPLKEKINHTDVSQDKFLKIPSKRKIEKLKKIEVLTLQELASIAKDLGVTIAIENSSPDIEEEHLWELSKRLHIERNLSSLIHIPQKTKSIILREISQYNYSSNVELLVEQIKNINRENVGITFDFGHAFLASRYYHFNFLESVKFALPYIKHVHMHDCFGKPKVSHEELDINLIQFGIGDLHLPVGWGEIPYQKIFRILKKYQGIICLELKPRYKKFFIYSMQNVRELVKNAGNIHKLGNMSPFMKDHHKKNN